MKKAKVVPLPTYRIENCTITNGYVAVNEHTAKAIEALAQAIKANAEAISESARALKGGDAHMDQAIGINK